MPFLSLTRTWCNLFWNHLFRRWFFASSHRSHFVFSSRTLSLVYLDHHHQLKQAFHLCVFVYVCFSERRMHGNTVQSKLYDLDKFNLLGLDIFMYRMETIIVADSVEHPITIHPFFLANRTRPFFWSLGTMFFREAGLHHGLTGHLNWPITAALSASLLIGKAHELWMSSQRGLQGLPNKGKIPTTTPSYIQSLSFNLFLF